MVRALPAGGVWRPMTTALYRNPVGGKYLYDHAPMLFLGVPSGHPKNAKVEHLHGIGLDIHEGPYLVGSDATPLDVGMCFSNEPMICVPGEFGVRLEDHFYMAADGPRWFTEPSRSIEDPFG